MKIHIFGASGSGVTTLGQTLAAALQLPYFDSDAYFWEPTHPPFILKRAPDLRNAAIRADLDKHNSWVLGGSAVNWGADVFPPFDLIVFLWLPPAIRMERLKARELERYGELIFTDAQRHAQYQAFMAWAGDYDNCTGVAGRTIKVHEQWLQQQTSRVLQIRGDLTVAERLEIVMEAIPLLPLRNNK